MEFETTHAGFQLAPYFNWLDFVRTLKTCFSGVRSVVLEYLADTAGAPAIKNAGVSHEDHREHSRTSGTTGE